MDSTVIPDRVVQSIIVAEESKLTDQSTRTSTAATSEALGAFVRQAAPSLEAATANLSLASSVQGKFSPESVHKMLEINMEIVPPLDSLTFNSFMQALALTAATVPYEERQEMLAATLVLFGEHEGGSRASNLRNAVYAFPCEKPGGGTWSWLDFSDPMYDPLDDKKVYDL